MREATQPGMILRSQLAGDPDMMELIDLFLGELPKRVDSLSRAWNAREWQTLQRVAHQIKGSGAGYGFPSIGAAAAKVEDRVRAVPRGDVALEELGAGVRNLISLCHSAVSSSAKAA
jgi:HPt (histidine-containing phosphotransfer) domain-containing protein